MKQTGAGNNIKKRNESRCYRRFFGSITYDVIIYYNISKLEVLGF